MDQISSPEFFKTGTTDDDIQQAGKQEAARYLWYSLGESEASSGKNNS